MDKKILIVEDDDSIRNTCERMARTGGFSEANIYLASSAEEALEILGKQKFDFLLTDNNMSGITGLELIAQCKEKFPSIKVILMSGRLQQLKDNNKIPDGIWTIAKPFKVDEFCAIIKKALA